MYDSEVTYGTVCGYAEKPQNFTSTSHILHVYFHSDRSGVSFDGFEAVSYHIRKGKYIEDIYFFEVNTKYKSSSVLKTSEFSRVRSREEPINLKHLPRNLEYTIIQGSFDCQFHMFVGLHKRSRIVLMTSHQE